MQQRTKTSMRNLTFAMLAMSLVVVGCGPDPTTPIGAAPAGTATDQPFVPQAEAGIKLAPADPTQLIADASAQQFSIRPDPFSLRAHEVSYDRSQFAERMLDTQGFYRQIAELPVIVEEVIEIEPQPSRRLAGIILGDSISALIDMGTGGPLLLVRPGQKIDGTEWTVQSIDEEKAVLRRDKESKKRPQFVVVRLQPDDGGGVVNPGAGTGRGQGEGQGEGQSAGGQGGGGRAATPD